MKALSKYLACCCAAWILLGGVAVVSAQTVGTTRTRIPQDGAAVALNNFLAQAQAAMDRKDYEAAVQAYHEYLAKKPDDATVHYDLGYAYTAMQKFSDAKAEYEKAISLDPKMSAAYQNLGLTLLTTEPSAAVAPLQKAAELMPEDARTKWLLGTALEKNGKLDLAIEEYEAAKKLDGKDADFRASLGHALLSAGHPSEAESVYREALSLHPEGAELGQIHVGLAQALIAQKKIEEATRELAAYLQSRPDDANVRVELAAELAELGKNDEALTELDRATGGGSENLRALKLRVQIASQRKHYDDAVLALQKATALAPQDADLAAELGHIYLEKKDYPSAVNELIVAFKMNQTSNDVLGELVTAEYLNKNYAGALKALDLLSQRKTLPMGSWFIRATCYDKLGQPAQALDAYKKFLELNTDLNNDMYFEASARVRTLTRELKKR
ncbi:MAG TPA: tetratricopeptide repeat protein [Candidatus Sulfotelmatobacter sp.]|nr:tetratricopeptide repeat protein [Candidatus Sulfotelmatobacter sp.]